MLILTSSRNFTSIRAGNQLAHRHSAARRSILPRHTCSGCATPISAQLGTRAAGAFPREMAVSADGSTLFLTNFGSKSLQVIDRCETIDVKRLPVTPVKPLNSQHALAWGPRRARRFRSVILTLVSNNRTAGPNHRLLRNKDGHPPHVLVTPCVQRIRALSANRLTAIVKGALTPAVRALFHNHLPGIG